MKDPIRIAGLNYASERKQSSYGLAPTRSDPNVTLGGTTDMYYGTIALDTVAFSLTPLELTDLSAAMTILSRPGMLPFRILETGEYLSVQRDELDYDPATRVFHFTGRIDPRVRLTDYWGYNANFHAGTVWTLSPLLAYILENDTSMVVNTSGLAVTGSGSWDTSIRENDAGKSTLPVIWLEAYLAVPSGAVASLGIITLGEDQDDRYLGTDGAGVYFNTTQVSFVGSGDTLSGTVARAGGTYRVQIQDRDGVCRILVWENGTILLRSSAIQSGASGLKGAVFGVKTNTATLTRWWVGGI